MTLESAIVSINGKVMGELDDLVKQPRPEGPREFKEAMRGFVERSMPPAETPEAATVPVQMGFDYRQIEEQYRDEVKQAAQVIRAQGHAMRTSILKIGRRLIEVKGMLPHGVFGEWIAAEFGMSERMSQNIMNVAREYEGKSAIISFLSDTVLYMLAAPSTPPEARAEVEQAAAQGKKITVEFAKETIQKRKPDPVMYTSAIVLENMVGEWVEKHVRETTHTPLAVLAFLDEGTSTRADKERRQLAAWLREQDMQWRVDDDLSQAIKHVRARRQIAANQASGKVVYLGSEVEQPVMRLLTLDMRSDAFNALLLTASADQLLEALKRVPPASDKERYLKIGNRRELLMLAQDAAQVDALIQAAMPTSAIEQATQIAPDQITPRDLRLAGFEIVREDEHWRWKKDGVFGGVMGNDGYLFNDRQKAIAEARRAAAKDYKYRAHEEYYPVKHGLGVMPADLLAAGYSLENGDGSKEEEVGKHGYRWRIGDEVGPDVAYGGCAIEGARAHYEAYKPTPQAAQLTPLEQAIAEATPAPKPDLTPADLRDEGIIIEESVPNYFRWVDTDESRYRAGALHDTAEQAIASARHNFGIYETDEAAVAPDPTPDDLAAKGLAIVPSEDGKGWRTMQPLGEASAIHGPIHASIDDAIEHARKAIALIETYPAEMITRGLKEIGKAAPSKVTPKAEIADTHSMSLGECLSIFELAKTAARRAVELQPSLRNAALDMQPSLRRLIEATRKVVSA